MIDDNEVDSKLCLPDGLVKLFNTTAHCCDQLSARVLNVPSAHCARRLSSGFGSEHRAHITPSHCKSWSVCLVWEIDTPLQQILYAALTLRAPSPISNRLHRPLSRPVLCPFRTPVTAVVSTSSPYHIGPVAYFPYPPQRAKVLQVYLMQMSAPQIYAVHLHVDCCLRKIFPRPHPRMPMQTPLVMSQAPI